MLWAQRHQAGVTQIDIYVHRRIRQRRELAAFTSEIPAVAAHQSAAFYERTFGRRIRFHDSEGCCSMTPLGR